MQELCCRNYFGKYGSVSKVILNSSYKVYNSKHSGGLQAYVTYENYLDAALAICVIRFQCRPLTILASATGRSAPRTGPPNTAHTSSKASNAATKTATSCTSTTKPTNSREGKAVWLNNPQTLLYLSCATTSSTISKRKSMKALTNRKAKINETAVKDHLMNCPVWETRWSICRRTRLSIQDSIRCTSGNWRTKLGKQQPVRQKTQIEQSHCLCLLNARPTSQNRAKTSCDSWSRNGYRNWLSKRSCVKELYASHDSSSLIVSRSPPIVTSIGSKGMSRNTYLRLSCWLEHDSLSDLKKVVLSIVSINRIYGLYWECCHTQG